MKISGKTMVVALLGHPVEHSLSPDMHNSAFGRMGLDYCYVALPVRPEMLREAVAGIRALGLAGANVTVPHKEAVMPLLDEIDAEAAFIGAVNTVVVTEGGRLLGYNTDGRGFMKSLEEKGVETEGKRVLLVGAGGAARAISYYLCGRAAEVYLFDVDARKAERLVSDLSINHRNVERLESMGGLGEMDILINATPLGLRETDPPPMDVSELGPGHTVVDLIYRQTRLLSEASARGCVVMDGLGMLLWQGVLASELWTGRKPPHEVMREALKRGLE